MYIRKQILMHMQKLKHIITFNNQTGFILYIYDNIIIVNIIYYNLYNIVYQKKAEKKNLEQMFKKKKDY